MGNNAKHFSGCARALRRAARRFRELSARLFGPGGRLRRRAGGEEWEDEGLDSTDAGGLRELRREQDRPDPLALPSALLRYGIVMAILFAAASFPRSAVFEAREIVVRGPGTIPAGEIRALAGVRPGMNLFQIDPRRVAERVRRHPRVRAVQVNLALPHRLEIAVTERKPWLALPYSQPGPPQQDPAGTPPRVEYVLLDEEGVALARASSAPALLQVEVEDLVLPWIILGEPLPSAGVRLAGAVAVMLPPAVRAEAARVAVDAQGEVTLYLRLPRPAWTPGDPPVFVTTAARLGRQRGIEERVARLPEILEVLSSRDLAVEYLDLRFGANVVIRLHSGAAGEAR